MFGQTNLSGRDLSNMFESYLPDNCRLYVGVVSVLSGSVRGRVGLNSATDSIWFVGVRSVMYRAYVGRPDAIQDRIKSDITPNCVESADTFPNQTDEYPTYLETKPNVNRQPFVASYLHIKAHKNFRKVSLHQSGARKWHF